MRSEGVREIMGQVQITSTAHCLPPRPHYPHPHHRTSINTPPHPPSISRLRDIKHIQMLSVQAFDAAEQVVDAFKALTDKEFCPPAALPITDHFEDTWIEQPSRWNSCCSSTFALQMWSCFRRMQQDVPKANNTIEGWHRASFQPVSVTQPTLWKFIKQWKESNYYYYYYYYYNYYYIPDSKPQLGEPDAKNPKATAGKTAQ